ncbi:FISUMP domain-containing protein [Wenyingzhuangia aestuarii]|uniref:FISUMP domain-containing protein n=1 Tax=Wenyingzhuangia aestuarii TaxID=1647582 RepID=UPI00143B870B|nr:FISUMP domain-containing protein [Wenyingzhuangia aestuarii]NJB82480.1 uncharacterized protein (TIGR02145 family) [Wenyingzhuangia aestuarii]
MMTKSLFKYMGICLAVLIFACTAEFDNPYDSEVNKPELFIGNDLGWYGDPGSEYAHIGLLQPKQDTTAIYSILNIGKGILTLDSVTFTGDSKFSGNFSRFKNLELLPGKKQDLSITFYSDDVNKYEGDINFYASALNLNGDGTPFHSFKIKAETIENGSEGDVTLSTQKQIDDFNYTLINGNLIISGTTPNSITNLDGLKTLKSISKSLLIKNNNSITNINGLKNLNAIGGYLDISNNLKLTSLTGLENLSEIPTDLVISDNISLKSIASLSKILKVGYRLAIFRNNSLEDLEGLDNLISVGSVTISANKVQNPETQSTKTATFQIKTLDTLDSNSTVNQKTQVTVEDTDRMFIQDNVKLKNLCALSSLFNSNGLTGTYIVSGNAFNLSEEGFSNDNCADETSNIALGDITLTTQNEINTFDYTGITGKLTISETTTGDIKNLNSLMVLKTIGGNLEIHSNSELENLKGLDNLTAIKGDLSITNNTLLNNYCSISELVTNDAIEGESTIDNNKYDPTKQNFIDGDCTETSILRNNLSLTTQEEVNSFDYTEITGNLTISGSAINDLSPLSSLTTVGGFVGITNTSLTKTNGLENLTKIEKYLFIYNNASLDDISSLNKLTSLTYLQITSNANLTSLEGLEGLEKITSTTAGLIIENNIKLDDISALSNITSTDIHFKVTGNSLLKDFCAFSTKTFSTYNVSGNGYDPDQDEIKNSTTCEKPTVYNGALSITTQAQIEQYSDITEITGNLIVSGSAINDLSPLSKLTTVGGSVAIQSTSITNLNGLENLSEINGAQLNLYNNTNLEDISSLTKIKTLGSLYIQTNNKLTNLEGLNNLETITSASGLYIRDNSILSDISALENITEINSKFYVVNNTLLKDFCPFTTLFNAQTFSTYTVSGNGYDPDQNEIKNSSSCEKPTVHNGALSLTTQAQVEQYSDITEITGNLTIAGSAINDLSPLSKLTTVGGYVSIQSTGITKLSGLENLSEINGAYLQVYNNTSLEDISSLTKIKTLPYLIVYNNDKLTSLEGLNNLETITSASGLYIRDNSILSDISALENITEINSKFYVVNNTLLKDFCPFTTLFNAQTFSTYTVSGNGYDPNQSQIQNSTTCEKPTVYNGSLSLTTQAQIEQYSDITEITGNLNISGSAINDLSPLSKLTTVGGSVAIQSTSITNLNGLENLLEINGAYLNVYNNTSLENISSLTKITTLGSLYIQTNNKLTSLEGLNNLQTITTTDGLYISNNSILSDISALENITEINSKFYVVNNTLLKDFCPFTSLFNAQTFSNYTVYGNGYDPNQSQIQNSTTCEKPTVYNGNLNLSTQTQVDQYRDITEITGNLTITGSAINDLSPLSNLIKIGGYIDINSTFLTNLEGLQNIQNIGLHLYIRNNASIKNISSLKNITTIGYLYIFNNDSLSSLEGLNNIKTITTTSGLVITLNDALTDLSALSNVTSINHNFEITFNPLLKDFCSFTTLFNAQTFNSYKVSGNGYNPKQDEVKNSTSCNSDTSTTGTVTDNSGNTYKTVTIGTQTWMAENLRTAVDGNGQAIPKITTDANWGALGDNNTDKGYYSTNGTTYYSWAAANEACPQGWSLPSTTDMTTLNTFVLNDGHSNVGTALKSTSISGTDDYGFNAVLTGIRSSGNGTLNGTDNMYLWLENSNTTTASYVYFYGTVLRSSSSANKSYGFCVRCIKD